MRRLLASIAALFLLVAPAFAWIHGSSAPTGKSVLNMGGVSSIGSDVIFKNLVKSWGCTTSTTAGHVDVNGYPTDNTFSSYNCLNTAPSNYNGHYIITWTGTASPIQFQAIPATVYSGGAFVSGCGGASCAITSNITFTGTNGQVEFDMSLAVSAVANNGSGAMRLTVTRTNSLPDCPTVCSNGTLGSSTKPIYINAGGVTGWFNWTVVDATHIDVLGSTFNTTTAGSIVFAPTSTNVAFLTSVSPVGFTNLIMVRSSAPYTGDLAAVQGGVLTNQFNDDYVSTIQSLSPFAGRWMDNAGINNSDITRSAYQSPVGLLSYTSQYWPPNIWAGTIGGTNTLSATSYPDMPGSWIDGETFQGTVTNATTSLAVTGAASNGGKIQLQMASTATLATNQRVTVVGYNGAINYGDNGNGLWTITVDDATHITLTSGLGGAASVFVNAWTSGGSVWAGTINVGSRGAKLLASNGRESLFGAIGAGTQNTFVYDSVQDAVLVYSGSGLTGASSGSGIPVALRVAASNKLNIHYLHNFPHLYDLASVAADTAYIRDNLSGSLRLYPELSNETWNQGFTQTQVAVNRSVALGLQAFSSGLPGADWNAVRYEQVMRQVTTTWGGRVGLHATLASCASCTQVATIKQYLYEGFDLNGASFPLYCAYVGGSWAGGVCTGDPGYNTAPNRPIDISAAISYANYLDGAIINGGNAFAASTASFSSKDTTDMTTAADNWAAGGASQASALAWLDNDIRQGTTKTQTIASISGGNTFNVTAHGYTANQQGVLTTSGTTYTGASLNTIYYVVNPTANTYQLSLTSGGSAITVSGGTGTQFFGILASQTILYSKINYWTPFATAAAAYGTPREVLAYEGGFEGVTLVAAQCTALGISSTYCGAPQSVHAVGGTIWNLLIGYKQNAAFKATTFKAFTDQAAVYATGPTYPAWYTFGQTGGSVPNDPWSMLQTDLYGMSSTGQVTPHYFQSYCGMQQFNTGSAGC